MNKIFSIVCLGIIGGLYLIVLGNVYIIGLIFLLVNEILGTKKFKAKFNKLNKLVKTEFEETMNTFKSFTDLV